MDANKKEFIKFMQDSGVLTFGDFVTKSGRRTPYFVNTGNYCTGEQLHRLGIYYARCIKETIGDAFDVLFGPAYKGIPLAALTAAALYSEYAIDRPYFFNRKEVKDHGEGGSFVGCKLKPGMRVVYIEDVITAGTSISETIPLLRAAASDLIIEHEFITVDRMEIRSEENRTTAVAAVKEEFGLNVHPIVNTAEIIEYLHETSADVDLISRMEAYAEKYCIT